MRLAIGAELCSDISSSLNGDVFHGLGRRLSGGGLFRRSIDRHTDSENDGEECGDSAQSTPPPLFPQPFVETLLRPEPVDWRFRHQRGGSRPSDYGYDRKRECHYQQG